MLTDALVSEVRDLLDDGELSQRQIAKRTGVSRGTVGSIATGKREKNRRLANERRKQRKPCGPDVDAGAYLPAPDEIAERAAEIRQNSLLEFEPNGSREGEIFVGRIPERCPGCGGLVLTPCVLCAVRDSQGSPNCNIELVSSDELLDAMESLTFAAGQSQDWEDAIANERWTLVE